MAPFPQRLRVPAAALSGAVLALLVVSARVEPAPVATAEIRHVVTLHASGDPHAVNLLFLPGEVRTRQPYGVPFSVPGDLRAVVVVATAPDAGGAVDCTVEVDGERVTESGEGPRATATCAWPPAVQP